MNLSNSLSITGLITMVCLFTLIISTLVGYTTPNDKTYVYLKRLGDSSFLLMAIINILFLSVSKVLLSSFFFLFMLTILGLALQSSLEKKHPERADKLLNRVGVLFILTIFMFFYVVVKLPYSK